MVSGADVHEPLFRQRLERDLHVARTLGDETAKVTASTLEPRPGPASAARCSTWREGRAARRAGS